MLMTLESIPPWLIQSSPLLAVILIQARIIMRLLDRFYEQQERVLKVFQFTEKVVDVAKAVTTPESKSGRDER